MKYQLVKHLNSIWELIDKPNYKWSECKKLINTKTGREIKKVVNGGSIGYWIGGEFITLTNLKNKIQKIKKADCPF